MSHRIIAASIALALPLAAAAGNPNTEAVEYYNRGSDHYFVTATAIEAKSLDDGVAGPDWVRTGRSFQAWLDPASAPANAAAVCRFHSSAAGSHFYTANAAECEFWRGRGEAERQQAAVTGAPVTGWVYEGIAFYVEAPNGGTCPAGTVPVTRVYNDGFASGAGANHRFVDDSDLRQLMLDRAWLGEATAFCARPKASGSNANLPPTTSNFDVLAATWSGQARWKVENGGTRALLVAPLTLSIDAAGAVTGSGEGCSFAGSIVRGDGFRSLYTGSISATGCSNPAFNGSYRKFQLERHGKGTLAIRMKLGDGASEAAIEARLRTPAGPQPVATSTLAGVAGSWAGTVGWSVVTRQGGVDSLLVTSNSALSVSIGASGQLTASGFGCSFAGTLSGPDARGGFSGLVSISGCMSGNFTARVHREDGARLEIELENESEAAGVTTRIKIEGELVSAGSTPVAPVGTAPAGGLAGSYQSAISATVETRTRSPGSDTTTSVSSQSELRLSIGSTGGVSATAFGCSLNGNLTLADPVLQRWTGSVTASGCSDPMFNGTYAASAHPENGAAVEIEFEREIESANVRTKIKLRATAQRAS